MRLFRRFLGIAVVLSFAGSAFAQGFSYSFTNDPGNQAQETAIVTATGISVSPLIRGAGILAATTNNSFTADNFYDGATETNVGGQGNGTYGTLAEAIAQDEYFSFTITPDANYSYSLTSISLTAKRLGLGPSLYILRAGTPGNTASFFDVSAAQPVTANTGLNNITITGLTNITAPTEIRLYGYQSEGKQTQGGLILQDAVSGTLTTTFQPVPAPPAAVSLGIGGCLMGMMQFGIARTRRKKKVAPPTV